MLNVINYREMDPHSYRIDFPSVTELESAEYEREEKTHILKYLTNMQFSRYAVTDMGGIDAFSGEPFGSCGDFFFDGTYCWYDSLPFYVSAYNIALPEEFLRKVEEFFCEHDVENTLYGLV